MIFRRLSRNSAPEASIESGQYTLQSVSSTTSLNSTFIHHQLTVLCSYLIKDDVCFLCICDKSYPRKLAFTYLADIATEFTTTYSSQQYNSPNLRPYAFVEFDTFIQRTKGTYQNSRAAANLDKLNDELRDVTKVMTKNIEDLLYRGDSLERMGEMSGRLREDSMKYRKAAVRINWELLIKQVSGFTVKQRNVRSADNFQYGPFAGVGFIMLFFIWWRFF
jgi:vesicle transport protein SEC22